MAGKKRRKKRGEPEELHEIFYERMNMTAELEGLLEALFQEFLVLRLSPAWNGDVLPLLRAWASGQELDVAQYEALRRPRVSRSSEVRELTRQPKVEAVSTLLDEEREAADAEVAVAE